MAIVYTRALASPLFACRLLLIGKGWPSLRAYLSQGEDEGGGAGEEGHPYEVDLASPYSKCPYSKVPHTREAPTPPPGHIVEVSGEFERPIAVASLAQRFSLWCIPALDQKIRIPSSLPFAGLSAAVLSGPAKTTLMKHILRNVDGRF